MSNQGPAQEPTMEEILASIRRIISEDSGAPEAPAAEYEPAPAATAYAAPAAQPAYDEDEEEDIAFEDEEVMELSEALPDEPEPIYEEPEPAPPVYQQPVAAAPSPAPVYEDPEEEIYELEPEPEAAPVYEPEPEPEPEPVYEPEPVHQPVPAPSAEYAEADYAESDGEIAFEEPAMSATSQPSRLMSNETEQAAASSFGMLANSMLTSSGSGRTLEEVVGDQLKPMLKAWLDDNLPTLVERLVREEIERVSRRGR